MNLTYQNGLRDLDFDDVEKRCLAHDMSAPVIDSRRWTGRYEPREPFTITSNMQWAAIAIVGGMWFCLIAFALVVLTKIVLKGYIWL